MALCRRWIGDVGFFRRTADVDVAVLFDVVAAVRSRPPPCRLGVPSASRGGVNGGSVASSLSQLGEPGCFAASREYRPCAAAGLARIATSATRQYAVFTRGRISGIQLANGTHLDASFARRRNLRGNLNRLVQVARVDEIKAGKLFLRLRKGTIGHRASCRFAREPSSPCRSAAAPRRRRARRVHAVPVRTRRTRGRAPRAVCPAPDRQGRDISWFPSHQIVELALPLISTPPRAAAR